MAKRILTVLLAIVLASVVVSVVASERKTRTRPIEEWLQAQGTHEIDLDGDDIFGEVPDDLWVPPQPNITGWGGMISDTVFRFGLVDYPGLACDLHDFGTTMEGTVTERPMKDGRAEVKVVLHTKNANAWMCDVDVSEGWDTFGEQIRENPTLFGHRLGDVMGSAEPALADTLFELRFIIPEPGAPLPDQQEIAWGPDLLSMRFQMKAKGPLTAEFGVEEGTPGVGIISQVGLKLTVPPDYGVWPVENMKLHAIGKGTADGE
jgi:hypothetical protein